MPKNAPVRINRRSQIKSSVSWVKKTAVIIEKYHDEPTVAENQWMVPKENPIVANNLKLVEVDNFSVSFQNKAELADPTIMAIRVRLREKPKMATSGRISKIGPRPKAVYFLPLILNTS